MREVYTHLNLDYGSYSTGSLRRYAPLDDGKHSNSRHSEARRAVGIQEKENPTSHIKCVYLGRCKPILRLLHIATALCFICTCTTNVYADHGNTGRTTSNGTAKPIASDDDDDDDDDIYGDEDNDSSLARKSSEERVTAIGERHSRKKKLKLSKGITKEIEINSVNFIKLSEKISEIFIPDPTIIDVQMLTDNSLYVIGLAPGVTSFVINGKDGNALVDCKVRVTYPLEAIKEAIIEMYPDTSVELMSIDNSLIAKGKVPSPETASDVMEIIGRFVPSAKIVNKLAIETSTQVLLKVKIAEVTRSLTKTLGIDWKAMSATATPNGPRYGFLSGNGERLSKSLTENMKESKGTMWSVYAGGQTGLSGIIDALANESFASILAEPTLVALSGTSATFKSGGEQGYKVRQNGSDVFTTEFKQWGTSIEFTPVVIAEDRITIKVSPKVSNIISKADVAPELMTKEVSTTVELGSGESFAIAGLLQTDTSSASIETPFLADIPIFGALFRQSSVTKNEKELVIIVTPYIVKPSSKKLKTPTEMIPRLYSPLESIFTRKFHQNVKKGKNAGFSIR
ncbi:hypothetical protein FACS189472_11040 [Alphaproteobacteria bacterium]|nr:hypothetical protein FACS189472_11040 [Alphaproteobacteria bacterium]